MKKIRVALPLFLVAVLALACDRNPAGPDDDTTKGPNATPTSFGLRVSPDTLSGRPVANGLCPSLPPFSVPFDLTIVNNGGLALLITEITLRFTDTSNIVMPPVTLTAPMVTSRFGSATVFPGVTRALPMVLPLGCGIGRAGVLVVFVRTRDGRGREATSEFTATVR